MSNRDGKSVNKKKRDKYQKGKLCPKCKKGKLDGCDQHNKEGHKHHVVCHNCHDCNY